jgi:hypothetical protein
LLNAKRKAGYSDCLENTPGVLRTALGNLTILGTATI